VLKRSLCKKVDNARPPGISCPLVTPIWNVSTTSALSQREADARHLVYAFLKNIALEAANVSQV
jgi:hypothetical protein